VTDVGVSRAIGVVYRAIAALVFLAMPLAAAANVRTNSVKLARFWFGALALRFRAHVAHVDPRFR